MSDKAPGRHDRLCLSMIELFRLFPDDGAREKWVTELRCPDCAIYCPNCASSSVPSAARHKTMPLRCRKRGCAKKYSVRTGTVLESSDLSHQVWVIAIYQPLNNLGRL